MATFMTLQIALLRFSYNPNCTLEWHMVTRKVIFDHTLAKEHLLLPFLFQSNKDCDVIVCPARWIFLAAPSFIVLLNLESEAKPRNMCPRKIFYGSTVQYLLQNFVLILLYWHVQIENCARTLCHPLTNTHSYTHSHTYSLSYTHSHSLMLRDVLTRKYILLAFA